MDKVDVRSIPMKDCRDHCLGILLFLRFCRKEKSYCSSHVSLEEELYRLMYDLTEDIGDL